MAAQVREIAAAQGSPILVRLAHAVDPSERPAPTPGPWEIGYCRPTELFRAVPEHVAVCRADDRVPIALTGPTGCAQSEADARLIAAAPDLLAALEALHAYHYRPDTQELDVNDRIKELDRQAREALKKARGEE